MLSSNDEAQLQWKSGSFSSAFFVDTRAGFQPL